MIRHVKARPWLFTTIAIVAFCVSYISVIELTSANSEQNFSCPSTCDGTNCDHAH
jgi:hypothetical protein